MSCRATVIAFAAIVGAFSSGSTSAAEDSIKVLFFGDNGHHLPILALGMPRALDVGSHVLTNQILVEWKASS